jgi:hypothetical protein
LGTSSKGFTFSLKNASYIYRVLSLDRSILWAT